MVTISKAPQSVEALEKFLTENGEVKFDEALAEAISAQKSKAEEAIDASSSSEPLSDLDKLTAILALSTGARVVSDPKATRNREQILEKLERLRETLNRRQNVSEDVASLCGLLKDEPVAEIAQSLYLSLVGVAAIPQLLAEIGSAVELCGLKPAMLASKPPPTARAVTKELSNVMNWMFDDSKISDRKSSEGLTTSLLLNVESVLGLSRDVIQDMKSEFDGAMYKGVEGAAETRRRLIGGRSMFLRLAVPPLAKDLIKLAEVVLNTVDAAFDGSDSPSSEVKMTDDDQLDNMPSEAVALKNAIGSSGVAKQSSQELRSQLNSLQTDGSSKNETDLLLECTSVLHECVVCLLKVKYIETYNKGIAKMKQGKKSVSWTLKMGKGAEAYWNVMPSLNVPLHSLSALLRNRDTLSRALTARNQITRKPKVPKGCVDFEPHQMRLRETLMKRICDIFKLFGAEPIDTPVFELKEVLTGKYGEDTKLIYDLKDQGGEQLGLRYDLTVPFARFCASNAIDKIKRYHIGKVYRRDEPQVAKGRLREFYQCDVDIAGNYGRMTADAEILAMAVRLLDELSPLIGNYMIKVSHRRLLDGMMEVCGVPSDKLRAISSAIDKLDKESWETVEREMVEEKGLDPAVASKLKQFVSFKGTFEEVIESLKKAIPDILDNVGIKEAFEDLSLLSEYLQVVPSFKQRVVLDTSLARGLDYYTGLIYEAIVLDGDVPVGSIAAGGRYDKLIGMFSGKDIPAVGISLGVERVFRLAEAKFKVNRFSLEPKGTNGSGAIPTNKTDVYVCAIGGSFFPEKMKIANLLRTHNIRTEIALNDQKLVKQLPIIIEQNIPFGVLFGEDELKKGVVKVKEFVMASGGENGGSGGETEVAINDLPTHIKAKMNEQGRLSLDTILLG